MTVYSTAKPTPPMKTDDESGYLQIVQKAHSGVDGIASTMMSWEARTTTTRNTAAFVITDPGVVTGVTILRDAGVDYLPMDVGDDSSVTFWGVIRNAAAPNAITSSFGQLKTLKLDEDVGSGGTGEEEEGQEVAPWLSVQKSLEDDKEIVLMYIVYDTSEWETLIGGNTLGEYDDTDGDKHLLSHPISLAPRRRALTLN